MKNKNFTVSGMTCNGCAGTVNNIIKMQNGVNKVEVKWPENTAEVEFDENLVSEDALKNIVKMMGYELS